MKKSRPTVYSSMLLLALLVSACSSAGDNEAISTAVAQTVAAQNTLQAKLTPTPLPATATRTPLTATLTPVATKLPPTLPSGSNRGCLVANLVGESGPVDGQIMTPGQQFTKTWQITNNSACGWDTTYKIVFWDGELMGGATYYNFPQYTSPGNTVDVSLVLTAPITDGTYRSSWMLQAPDGSYFGVGEYNVPFYSEIAVSSSLEPRYGVTKVEFETRREPLYGCPANVKYTVTAMITTSGPLEFYTSWRQSDDNNSQPTLRRVKEAGTLTLERSWQFHLGANTGIKWIALTVGIEFDNEFNTTDYPKQYFEYTCGQQ